jgi:hypothetical protein
MEKRKGITVSKNTVNRRIILSAMRDNEHAEDTLSESDLNALAEADEWCKHNKLIPHEEVLAEFGLTMVDWEKMADEPAD